MRTMIDISIEHRTRLTALAARRGERGLSALIAEALSQYLARVDDHDPVRERALATRGSLCADDEAALRDAVASIRQSWR